MDPSLRYLDHVKADDQLKERTKAYIRSKMTGEALKEQRFTPTRPSRAAAAIVSVLVAVTALGFAWHQTPTHYIALDVNPGIELGINAVGARGWNAAGVELLAAEPLIGLPADEAVASLVAALGRRGLLSSDGTSLIALSVYNSSAPYGAVLAQRYRAIAAEALAASGQSGILYGQSAPMRARTLAAAAGIAPGKYLLAATLAELGRPLDAEAVNGATLKDLLLQCDALIAGKGAAGAARYGDIQAAADSIRALEAGGGDVPLMPGPQAVPGHNDQPGQPAPEGLTGTPAAPSASENLKTRTPSGPEEGPPVPPSPAEGQGGPGSKDAPSPPPDGSAEDGSGEGSDAGSGGEGTAKPDSAGPEKDDAGNAEDSGPDDTDSGSGGNDGNDNGKGRTE